jgi:hypothetical protein
MIPPCRKKQEHYTTGTMNYEHFAHPNKNIFLVDMTKELDHYFSELTNKAITKYLNQGKKI